MLLHCYLLKQGSVHCLHCWQHTVLTSAGQDAGNATADVVGAEHNSGHSMCVEQAVLSVDVPAAGGSAAGVVVFAAA